MSAAKPYAYFDRDADGFWTAYIEEDAGTPESRRFGSVRRREALPVPMSATREEAERAFVRLMSREARCRYGHR